MKLQNLSVIFIIIVLPILLIVSYYISLQIDTINMQTAYNTKLLDSTKEAIDAFEINTVEWNANYSETADSKRRDIMASINTFITSFANNTGVAGTSKDYMLSRIPAIAVTLYDGYYIYAPSENRIVVKDDNGLAVYMSKKLCNTKYTNDAGGSRNAISGYSYPNDNSDDGKILYVVAEGKPIDGVYETKSGEKKQFTLNPENAATEYKHILKPFTAYSEQLTNDIVINYTLDNYITLYGKMKDTDGTDNYISKSGYLTDISKINIKFDSNNGIRNIKFDGENIKPEKLEEKISYTDDEVNYYVGSFNYVYEAEGNTKVYYDEVKREFFQLDSDSKRIYMSELPTELYKKCTVPRYKGGQQTYVEYYQSLEDTTGNWFYKDSSGNLMPATNSSTYGLTNDILADYNAINYCVESYLFTKWVDELAKANNIEFLKISGSNDPDPATNANKNSAFENHKREVMQSVINSNLNQAITSYSRRSADEFYLPELTETDWDQVLKNASIITFVQNIPIGMKFYNNYAVVTSTVNKEYVDPNEIYLNASGDKYYHMPYCSELDETNLTGYRSIDYIQKSYIENTKAISPKTLYYYKHDDNTNINIDVEEACYNCLVQKNLYDLADIDSKDKRGAYYTTLTRERYIARMSTLPAEVQAAAYIYVETVDENTGKNIDNAKYTINGSIMNGNGGRFTIPRGTTGLYKIRPIIEDENIAPGGETDLGEINFPKKTITAENVVEYLTQESTSTADVNVIEYGNENIKYNITNLNNAEGGGANEPKVYGNHTGTLSLENDAYINIKLKYKQNYTNVNGEITQVTANIDNYNTLTIGTTVQGISGKIRLKFTNGEKIFYSEDIFEWNKEDLSPKTIYCKIEDNTCEWYLDEWKVEVLSVDNNTITSARKIDYYTINDGEGLREFADAVNGTKGLTKGAKTSGRTFKLIADITEVGNTFPIAGKEKDSNKDGKNDSFEGIFDGQGYKISELTIDIDNNYNALGLFGWVGASAEIKNLSINNITVKYKGSNNNIKLGGLAGYCDANADSIGINNIHIDGGTITGGKYTGGIVGENKRTIDNCTVSNMSRIEGNGDTGGIAGSTTNSISNCNVNNISKISGTESVGGISGYAENTISNCNVNYREDITSNISEITSGDNAGGIVGNTSKSITNCKARYISKISGTGSVGGIAGYTTSTISSCSTSFNTIGNANFSKDKLYHLFIGGIAGYTTGEIKENCSVNATNIGTGNVTMKKSSDEVTIVKITIGGINKYCVGGIVGYTNSNITRTTLNDNVQIKGGKISVDSSVDSKAFDCTGGRVGYKQSSQQADSSWTINCYVSGYDNVGGIIGYNKNGNITGITRSGNVNGAGANVGGIVGCNEGGTISNCTNKGNVTGTGGIEISKIIFRGDAKGNVGGIVGLNYNKDIIKCRNMNPITGKCNVGGIVGLNYGGIIELCENSQTIRGTENRNNVFAYETSSEYCTGTGGIAGKIYSARVTKSKNTGNVECNYNGGGIAGLDHGSVVQYSYNSGKISSSDRNRIGGICGAGNTVSISACYNIGNIEGVRDEVVLHSGIGGIIGSCVDDAYFLYMGEQEIIPANKYISESINIDVVKLGETENNFILCYNVGSLSGNASLIKKTNGIVGCVLWAPGGGKPTFINNLYKDNTDKGAQDSWSDEIREGLTRKNGNDLKKELYNWATKASSSGGQLVPGTTNTYIYNTTAPVETTLGYEGYGILWWQLQGYGRTTFHIYDNVGVPLYPPTLYINSASKYLENDEYYCNKRNITTYGYILMLKEGGSYTAKASQSNYVEETNRTISVVVGQENDVYLGKRPEFILGINSEDNNGSTIKQNLTIPNGNYYIIASGGGGSGPAYPAAYIDWDKNGGGSSGGFIGRVKLEATDGTKYYCEVGGPGSVYWDNAVNKGHDGGNTILKRGNTEILKVTGGKAGGSNYAGKGGTVTTNSLTILREYLKSNGYDGTTDKASSLGAESIMNDTSKNRLAVGIGKDRGSGGTNYYEEIQDDETGTGGCLYILSESYYNVVKIDVPDNSYNVTINVSGDTKTQPRDSIINTNISVGTIAGNGDQAFIVRKGATVNYTVSREHYNTKTGSFIVGQNIDSNNEQIVTINLSKKILTHTITSSGANITVRGNFTDSNGNITETSKTGTGSVQFKVWSGDSNVSYTVSKTYYNTKTDSISVTSNGGTTNVTLDKTKYFVKNSNVRYAHSQNWGLYKWRDTGRLNSDDGSYDNAYMYGKKNATITISTVSGIPNNWIMYLDGCYAGTSSNTRLTVSINGTQRLSKDNISNDENNNYTITGTGTTVNNIVIRFEGRSAVAARNFYLDSVYFIVND